MAFKYLKLERAQRPKHCLFSNEFSEKEKKFDDFNLVYLKVISTCSIKKEKRKKEVISHSIKL